MDFSASFSGPHTVFSFSMQFKDRCFIISHFNTLWHSDAKWRPRSGLKLSCLRTFQGSEARLGPPQISMSNFCDIYLVAITNDHTTIMYNEFGIASLK